MPPYRVGVGCVLLVIREFCDPCVLVVAYWPSIKCDFTLCFSTVRRGSKIQYKTGLLSYLQLQVC
jgi:hypothetical protein